MKNLWPEFFEENKIDTPKQILEVQSKFLPKLTGDLVYAEVMEDDDIFDTEYAFKYVYLIRGKFLEHYKFRLLYIKHDIAIYPVKITLDDEVVKELRLEGNHVLVHNERDFVELLEKVLKSERVKKVISSIMSLSR